MFGKKKSHDYERTPSVRENYTFNLLYQVLTLLTPLLTTPYVARILGADGTGVQSYTNSVVSYFAILAALGTASYGQREIARSRKDRQERSRVFWEIELLCAGSTLICLAAWLALILVSSHYTSYYMVLTLTLVAVAFDVSWFYGGMEQYRLIAVRNMLVKLAGIAVLFLLVKKKDDLLLYVGLLAATGFLGNVSMWGYLGRYVDFVPLKELKIRRHIRQTLIYFIPTVATSIYTVLDKTMLGAMTEGKSQNGYYEYATGFVNMAKILLISFNTVMSARMSYLFAEEDYEEIDRRKEGALRFVLLLGLPITFGLMGIAGTLIPWFLGDGYEGVIGLLAICSPLVMIVGFSDFMGSQLLTPSGQRGRSSKAIVAGACANVCLNLILIPKFAAAGAALASVAAECLITGLYFYLCKDYLKVSMVLRCGYKNLIAALVMYAGVRMIGTALGPHMWSTLLQIIGGAGIYGVLLLVLKDKLVWDTIEEMRQKFIKV